MVNGIFLDFLSVGALLDSSVIFSLINIELDNELSTDVFSWLSSLSRLDRERDRRTFSTIFAPIFLNGFRLLRGRVDVLLIFVDFENGIFIRTLLPKRGEGLA